MTKQNININDFKFTMPLPIRWNDMDLLGHVNNIYYFEYFQIARGEYMPVACEGWDWTKNMFVIAHIECDFFVELSLRHKNPIIKARTVSISTKSFEMEYIICSDAKDGSQIIHAKGSSINVLIDIEAKKSTLVPDWIRENLEAFDLR